ncbi:hypothetical protein Dimus_025366, partial [Dionaea muscipula]
YDDVFKRAVTAAACLATGFDQSRANYDGGGTGLGGGFWSEATAIDNDFSELGLIGCDDAFV